MKHKNRRKMNEEIKNQKSPGQLINDCLFWVEGLVDDTCQTSDDVLALFDRAIDSLQRARKAYSSKMEGCK